MQFARHKWRWALWFTLGGVAGTYLPLTPLWSELLATLRWVDSKPDWLYLPTIALLFLLCLQPAARILRRYLNNLRSKNAPFTVIEGTLASVFGFGFAISLGEPLPQYWISISRLQGGVALTWIAALAVFAGLLIAKARIQPEFHAPPRSDATKTIDLPITDDAEDTLGRVPFVNDLYQQIKRFPFDEPVVFGLNGQWGSGKTSVMNLLRNRLRRDGDVILVDFNPWYFSPKALVHRFYSAVANAINREFFFPDLFRRHGSIPPSFRLF